MMSESYISDPSVFAINSRGAPKTSRLTGPPDFTRLVLTSLIHPGRMQPMDTLDLETWTAFLDDRRLLCTHDDLDQVVLQAQHALASGEARTATVFRDATGARTEVEPTGGAAGVRSRLAPETQTPRREGPGRPKLGVVSREVSLLPRHWDWLNAQPGGASAALRRLVDAARKATRARDAARQARDAAYAQMVVLGGDLPGFEEASRALFAADFERAAALTQEWPEDLGGHVRRLLAHSGRLADLGRDEAD